MATVRCKGCQNLVAFRGRAAECPQCGGHLRLPGPGDVLDLGESADPKVGPAVPTLVAEYGRAQPGGKVQRRKKNQTLVLGAFGGISLVVLAGGLWFVYTLLNPAPSTPPSAPVVTPPTPYVPVPTPTPKPKPQPAVAPAPASAPATQERTWTPILPSAPVHDIRGAVTEAKVEAAVRRGVDNILSAFDGPYLRDGLTKDLGEHAVGTDALAVYALVAAGKELEDNTLDVRSPQMRAMLDKLKTSNPTGDVEVYSRSLRLQCLAYANRPEDHTAIENDLKWLLKANVAGAFNYREQRAGETLQSLGSSGWDTSNSQYGLLGVWAASMAGFQTPVNFWQQVEQLWLTNQDVATGGWGYRADGVSATMTCAGVNALMVSGDQLQLDPSQKMRDGSAGRAAAARGIEYLSKENRIPDFNTRHYGYAVYSVERVGLATGMKFIGEVDWFRVLAERLLRDQQKDGGWPATERGPVDTSFATLFLVRGKPPIMMAKLKYDGPWQKSPRDLANLTVYSAQKTEHALNWQTVDLKRSWREWMDAPVVMLSGSDAIDVSDEDVANLRDYILHGGMVFTHADNGKEAFSKFAAELAARVLPEHPLEALPPEHPIYSMVYRPNPAPPLLGMTNGNRLVWLHSPTDLTGKWLRRIAKDNQQSLETGLNVFIYAAGKGFTRNRVDTPVLPPPEEQPVGSMTLARIKFAGAWDPEPVAWPRIAQDFELSTRIHVDVKPMAATELGSPLDVPVASLTSTGEIALSFDDVKALRKWVEAGGVLVLDACGGTRRAGAGVSNVLPAILGVPPGPPIGVTSALLTGSGYGEFGRNVSKVTVSDYTLGERGGRNPPPRITRVGKGMVISSDLDITTGLLETGVWGISGYTSDWTRGFVYNTLLSVANGTPGQAGPIEKSGP